MSCKSYDFIPTREQIQ